MIDGRNIRYAVPFIGIAIAVVLFITSGAGSFKPYPPHMRTVQAQNWPQKFLNDAVRNHQEESRSELNTRSMPFWGQVYMASTDRRSELRWINEVVRKEALNWILDEGSNIKVVNMTSSWHTTENLVRFVVTIYYNEEEK